MTFVKADAKLKSLGLLVSCTKIFLSLFHASFDMHFTLPRHMIIPLQLVSLLPYNFQGNAKKSNVAQDNDAEKPQNGAQATEDVDDIPEPLETEQVRPLKKAKSEGKETSQLGGDISDGQAFNFNFQKQHFQNAN